MVQFFATRAHDSLFREFLDSWTPADNARVRVVCYEKFPLWKRLPNGVCIFTDLERLLPGELPLAGQLADALRAFPGNYTVLNDPGRYAGRFNLLKILHQRGLNDFDVHRVDELRNDLQFPVFLRNELNHDGPMTPLLHSRDELNRVLAQNKFQKPALRKHLMLVEYCDCTDGNGLFRKYSVMKIAGRCIPRHVLFSGNWVTKTADLVNEQTVAEEIEFVENFPHGRQILEIFRIAGLDYGRIDYGVRKGRVQAWEINTHPVIVPRREKIDPRRLPLQSRSAWQIIEALRSLYGQHPNGAATPFRTRRFVGHKLVQLLQRCRLHRRR